MTKARELSELADKIAVDGSGVDVTGTVTADGLTVGGTEATFGGSLGEYKIVIEGSAAPRQNYIGMTGYDSLVIAADEDNLGTASDIQFRVDAKQVAAFSAGGDISFYEYLGVTPKFFWDASAERLGIGTSSPLAKLHVESASGSGGRVLFGGSTTSAYNTHINVTDTGMEFWAQSNARGLTFSTGSTQTERMRIDASGRVGIGTSNPSRLLSLEGSGIPLSVNSTNSNANKIQFLDNGVSRGFIGARSGAPFVVQDSAGANEFIRVTDAGSVGIGTSSPAVKLHVSHTDGATSARFAGASYAVRVQSIAGIGASVEATDQNESTYQPLYVGGSQILFTTSATERMRINSSGNVGIGVAPSFTLDVYRSGSTTSAIVARNDTSTTAMYATSSASFAGTTTNTPYGFITNNAERMRIDSSGSLLVGTTSSNGYLFRVDAPNNAAQMGLLTTGRSGGEYPSVGYNVVYSGSTGVYTRNATDTASMIRFNSGQVETLTAASGSGGSSISFTQGPYVAQGGTSWTNGSSDIRQKKNFEPTQGLSALMQVEPVKYHFDWEDDSATKRLGFKAQNLLNVIPEMVMEKAELADDGTPYLTITPDYILPVLVKAIQDQQAIIEALEARITALEA